MSKERAQIISASAELIKRHHYREVKPLTTHEDILTRLIDLRTKPQETFICLSLDGGQRLIAQRVVTIDSLDAALIHPRDIFTHPIGDNAASIVVAHNHPSGDPTPSPLDVRVTQQLVACGLLLGIPLRDHVIVSPTASYSFQKHHLL